MDKLYLVSQNGSITDEIGQVVAEGQPCPGLGQIACGRPDSVTVYEVLDRAAMNPMTAPRGRLYWCWTDGPVAPAID